MCSRTSAHYIHGAGCRWSELQMSAHMSLEYIKRVRLSNCLWKSIPGWNGLGKKRILKCVNRRLETLELSGMTSCWVMRTWYRMVLLWNFNQSICDLVHHGQSAVESTRLQGFPSKIRHHRRYGNRRFAASKWNVLHKSGCSTLCHFQFINIFLLVWVPDVWTAFKLGTDDSCVSLFLQVSRASIQSTSKKAQHAVCSSIDLINVLIPAKSALYCDS